VAHDGADEGFFDVVGVFSEMEMELTQEESGFVEVDEAIFGEVYALAVAQVGEDG
jgi:hypothetical protein